jgi:hypothetical protein
MRTHTANRPTLPAPSPTMPTWKMGEPISTSLSMGPGGTDTRWLLSPLFTAACSALSLSSLSAWQGGGRRAGVLGGLE